MLELFPDSYERVELPESTELKAEEIRKYAGHKVLIKDFHNQIKEKEIYQEGVLSFSEDKDVYCLEYPDLKRKKTLKKKYYVNDLEGLIVETLQTMMKRVV